MCRPIDADALMGVFAGEFPGMYSKRFIKHLIDGMPTMPEWVSVKDRLPEERGRYLCWFGKNTLCVGADIATYLPEWHGFGILETDTVLQNVTHWMPLPKQPEGVSEDGIT